MQREQLLVSLFELNRLLDHVEVLVAHEHFVRVYAADEQIFVRQIAHAMHALVIQIVDLRLVLNHFKEEIGNVGKAIDFADVRDIGQFSCFLEIDLIELLLVVVREAVELLQVALALVQISLEELVILLFALHRFVHLFRKGMIVRLFDLELFFRLHYQALLQIFGDLNEARLQARELFLQLLHAAIDLIFNLMKCLVNRII